MPTVHGCPMCPALPPRVAVASDQPLVTEVVVAALSSKGFECSVLGWPRVHDHVDDEVDEVPSCESHPDVALMISDFNPLSRIRGAALLMGAVPASWVVLAGLPRGPLWGALLELGSVHVAPATTGLDQAAELLEAVAAGKTVMPAAERRELVDAWFAVLTEKDEARARLDTMTPRESEVLHLLYAGTQVRTIARQLDVSEATVRTQVKRVLRKLDVRSQLAAVAALEQTRRAEARAHDVGGMMKALMGEGPV